MPHSVIDLGSNTPENLRRWSEALKRGGDKLTVWNLVYSSQRRKWTAKEIEVALDNDLSQKRVLTVCKKLVGDFLLHQIPGVFPNVYEKISGVQYLKPKILALIGNKKKRESLATKQHPQVKVHVRTSFGHSRTGRASEVTVEQIDQFSRVRSLSPKSLNMDPLSEEGFKRGLQRLFNDTGNHKDWGGERDDFFTNKLRLNGKRKSAAFALKGPGVGVKTMYPGKWGKRGTQIQRLVSVPATVFMLQFEGQIDEDSVEQLKKLTELKAHQENKQLFYGYIDKDDSILLRRAYPNCF
jgi:hypothetical protein